MLVKNLRALLDACTDDMQVFVKTFGDVEADEPDTFKPLLLPHVEIENVNGKDALVIADY